MICGRCGGTGADPEHEGKCGECLETKLQEAEEGNDVVAHLLALADFYEGRACAPSLDEYSEVDGLRRAAEIVKDPIRHFHEEIDKWYVKARVYGAIAAKYNTTLLKILSDVATMRADPTCPPASVLSAVNQHIKEALEWRHSEQGGVPMKAIEEMDDLLGATAELERLRRETCSS